MLVQVHQSIKDQETMRTSTTRFTFGSKKVWREISKKSVSHFSSSTQQSKPSPTEHRQAHYHINKIATQRTRTRTSSNSSLSSDDEDNNECPRVNHGCPRTTRIHAQRSIFPDIDDGEIYSWMQQPSESSESNIHTDSLDEIVRSI
jgi:hypothetical protein